MQVFIAIVSVVNAIALVTLSLILSKYLPAYFKKKGENLATKEDIGEITRQIEEVKAGYSSQLEQIRASLQVATGQQSAFAEARRQALLTFFEHCMELILNKLMLSPGDLRGHPRDTLKPYRDEMEHLFLALLTDSHRIALYFDQYSELPRAARDVAYHGSNAQTAFKEHFPSAGEAVFKEAVALEKGGERAFEAQAPITARALLEFSRAIQPHQDAMITAYQKYLQALNRYLQKEGRATVADPLSPEET